MGRAIDFRRSSVFLRFVLEVLVFPNLHLKERVHTDAHVRRIWFWEAESQGWIV